MSVSCIATGLWERVQKFGNVNDNFAEILKYVRRDDLYVKHEDEVAFAINNLSATPGISEVLVVALWQCVRLPYCSIQLTAALAASLASPCTDIHFPASMVLTLLTAVENRSRRQAKLGSIVFGSLGKLSPEEEAARDLPCRPRSSYRFTLDPHNRSLFGAGAGLFFIWLDKAAPLSDNCPDKELPAKYRENVAGWSSLYGTAATIFNGAQCFAAVQEASCHPEFNPGHSVEFVGLLEAYSAMAAAGHWIQCVDIARLAILWLAGKGSTYLDTDMAVGVHALPAHFWRSSVTQRWLESEDLRHILGAPMLVLAQDNDGLLQNNVLATAGTLHPALTLLIKCCLVCVLSELDVVSGTGPALITAALCTFQHVEVTVSPSTKLRVLTFWGAGGMTCQDIAPFDRNQLPAMVDSLPASHWANAWICLQHIPRFGMARFLPDGAGFTFDQCVHICPPSAFYRRHWRDIPRQFPDENQLNFGDHSWDCTWKSDAAQVSYYAGYGGHVYATGDYVHAYMDGFSGAYAMPPSTASTGHDACVPERTPSHGSDAAAMPLITPKRAPEKVWLNSFTWYTESSADPSLPDEFHLGALAKRLLARLCRGNFLT
jgi:hypothetical protein